MLSCGYAYFSSNECSQPRNSKSPISPVIHHSIDQDEEDCDVNVVDEGHAVLEEEHEEQPIESMPINTSSRQEPVVSAWNLFFPTSRCWPPPEQKPLYSDLNVISSMSDIIAAYTHQGIILLSSLVDLLHQYVSRDITEMKVGQILEENQDQFTCLYLDGPFTLVMISDVVRTECKVKMASKYIGGRFRKIASGMFRSPISCLAKNAKNIETALKVVLHCWEILKIEHEDNSGGVATMFAMKSVKLANQVRQRVGVEIFKMMKENFDGFLNLLEHFPDLFYIERIPKEDRVTLSPGAVSDWTIHRLFEDLKEGTRGQLCVHVGTQVEAQPNKSLHVGNVPSFFSEESFAHEFASFQPLWTNLVTQKGRRYGFINFATIGQAKVAKDLLSKTKLWKSNISYAKRENHTIAQATKCFPPLPPLPTVL